jgi:putative FmdB family regulatory protein
MPTYEYHCEKCDQNFDAFQSMKDQAFEVCPKELCRRKRWGKGQVKRLLGTGAGLLFKGSGFYATDYRSSGYKESAKKESGSSADGATKGEPKKTDSPKSESGKPGSTGSSGGTSKET